MELSLKVSPDQLVDNVINFEPRGLTQLGIWTYHNGMATMTVRSTYALDVETVRALEEVARRWKVSKSEALRRAIRAAARQGPGEAPDAVAALDALQQSLKLSPGTARAWDRRVRTERRASSATVEASRR